MSMGTSTGGPEESRSGASGEAAAPLSRVEPDPLVSQFFNEVDGEFSPAGIVPNAAIDPTVRNLTHRIAQVVAIHAASIGEPEGVQRLKDAVSQLGVTIRGTAEAMAGFYGVLKKFGPLEGADKPGFLVFAIIPAGHTAPRHIHHAPNGGALSGEITISLIGSLRYKLDGKVMSHGPMDGVRLSPAGSVDEYLEQSESWVGLYLQSESAELAPLQFEE